MKLKSEIEQCGARMSVNYFDRDELNHDAMAAHALLQAMEEAQAYWDAGDIRNRAAEILAGWMGDRG